MLSFMPHHTPKNIPTAFLDARKLRCPMPSVHLRMKLDHLVPGQTLEMLGCGETALSNAKTLLAMLHYPAPETLSHDTKTDEWKILIPAKRA
ncbi:sulfurtransferase TusA family protein [Acetobacteraceae bacterium]|nr:sulfurtransferase TusA family protein [Acetobacteraceae bacterium]